MQDNTEDQISPELKDITEMIRRYIEANHKKVCFVASFIAFKVTPGEICPDCGDECNHEIAEDATNILAYGDIDNLRMILNDLRDIVEDSCDKKGFVNL